MELRLEDGHPGAWIGAPGAEVEIHAVHAPDPTWVENPGPWLQAARALRADFLVLPAGRPEDRPQTSALLGALEFLLEGCRGSDLRIALRPDPGSAPALAALLKDVQAESVGFCWDGALGDHLLAIGDRILTAVAEPDDDLAPLADLGYRWNVAVRASSPEQFRSRVAGFAPVAPRLPLPESEPQGLAETPLQWGRIWEDRP